MAMSVQWDQPATAKGLRRMASFARLVTYDQQGMGYSDRMDLSAPPVLEDLVADLEAVDRGGGSHRPDPLRHAQRRGGRRPVRHPPPGAPAHPVQHVGSPRRRPTTSPSASATASSTGWRSATGPNGAAGRISDEYASRRGDEPPGQYELAITSHNQLAHLFHMNRTYDIRHALPAHLGPDARHPPGGQREHPGGPRRVHRRRHPRRPARPRPGTDQLFLRNYGDARHRRGGAVRDRPPHPVRRPDAHDDALHRHRRLHAAGGVPGRRARGAR